MEILHILNFTELILTSKFEFFKRSILLRVPDAAIFSESPLMFSQDCSSATLSSKTCHSLQLLLRLHLDWITYSIATIHQFHNFPVLNLSLESHLRINAMSLPRYKWLFTKRHMLVFPITFPIILPSRSMVSDM